MLRSLLTASVAFLALVSGAAAADLPNTKGPAPFVPPPPVFTWTGFYVGGNAGLSGGDFDKTLTEAGSSSWETYGATAYGFSGGGQVGFNYQWPTTNYVVGFEADFQGSTLTGTYFNFDDPFGGEKAQSEVDWWGTARGRAGYAFGNALPYVTGGFAYGDVTNSYTYWNTTPASGSYSHTFTQTGWTVGAGLEYALTHNLTLKVEYLFTELGPSSLMWQEAALTNDPTSYASTKTTFNTVRAGLNWKFDWFTRPDPVAVGEVSVISQQ